MDNGSDLEQVIRRIVRDEMAREHQRALGIAPTREEAARWTAATTPPVDDPALSICVKCGKPIPPREAVVFYSGEKRHYHCAFTYASNVP